MRTKKKFIAIKPKTPEAIELFEYSMLGLQSCEVLETNSSMYHLKPIKADYSFWMKQKNDENWEIDK